MAYIDDWLAAMTKGVDPQQAAEFQNTARGGATVNYSGPEGTFRTLPMEPGGPGPAPGRTLQDILAEIGISGATDPRAIQAAQSRESALLSGGYRDNNEAARQGFSARTYAEMAGRDRAAEARLAYEDSLARGAQQGNPNAVAEMNRRKAINDASQLKLKELIALAHGDPDATAALMRTLGINLPTTGMGMGPIAAAREKAKQDIINQSRQDVLNVPGGPVDRTLQLEARKTAYSWRNDEGLSPDPSQIPVTDWAKSGYRQVTNNKADSIEAARGVLQNLQQMDGYVSQLFANYRPEMIPRLFEVVSQEGQNYLKAKSGDPIVQQYAALINESLPGFTTALGLTPGRLSFKALELEGAALPGPISTTTQESALAMLKNAKQTVMRRNGIKKLPQEMVLQEGQLVPKEQAGGGQGEGGQGVMNALPNAAQNKGRRIRDTVTGKRVESDGTNWVEVK